jgi:hypothetical protein
MSKLLTKQINLLKTDIQGLIETDIDPLEKELKMNQLKTLTEELNKMVLEEQATKQQTEYRKAARASDTIEYHKIKNKPNRSELMITIQENRERAKDEFSRFKQIEEMYQRSDSNLIPAFLFFHKSVRDAYGLCPFIKIEENTFENRERWLKSFEDQGKIYYDLYDKMVNESGIVNLTQAKSEIEMTMNTLHNQILNEQQGNLLSDTIGFLKEYIDCPIKTKKIKEKFKIVVNHFSILNVETDCSISRFFSLLFDFEIPVNLLPNRRKVVIDSDENIETEPESTEGVDNLVMREFRNSYEANVARYQQIKTDLVQTRKFINNTKANLKLELYEYLVSREKEIYQQTGQYMGKKLAQLTESELHDRLGSFAQYFVTKYLIRSDLIDISKKETVVMELTELLKKEQLNIKWNTKSGVIEKIHNLKSDTDRMFYIEPLVEKEQVSVKKTVSSKTILSKEMEKVINEELLKFILNKSSNTKETKDLFLEHLKIKLKLKRITTNDKTSILEKYDEIYNVVTTF